MAVLGEWKPADSGESGGLVLPASVELRATWTARRTWDLAENRFSSVRENENWTRLLRRWAGCGGR